MNPIYLQLFLLLNVFLMGVLAAIAARHAYAHFRPQTNEIVKPHPPVASAHLPPAVRQQLLEKAQATFQSVLDNSAEELQGDMKSTSAQLTKQLEKLGNEIVEQEMQRYRAGLDELREQTAKTMSAAQTEVETHQTELKAKLAERQTELETKLLEDMAAEKQRLMTQIDTKLSDAVASFLIETMQHNVDLGAQSAYLSAILEEHKADFKREVAE